MFAPHTPTFLDDAERDTSRSAVAHRAEELSADPADDCQSTRLIRAAMLPDDLQTKYANRVADDCRVPTEVRDTLYGSELIWTAGPEPIQRDLGISPSRDLRFVASLLAAIALLTYGLNLDPVPALIVMLPMALAFLISLISMIRTIVKGRAQREANAEARLRYGFNDDELATIKASAIAVPNNGPEMTLSAVADECASRITESEAWADPILDEHRLRFTPSAEATEIREHAISIAAIRSKLGEHVTTDPTVTAARRDINALLQSLTDRVAALWTYAEKIDKLSEPLRDLHAIRAAIDALPAIDTVARQMGVDELATRELQRLTDDADTITVTVEELAAELNQRLALPR